MADFNVNDCGSIVQITPMTEQASEWVDENVHTEAWQWLGASLCVDHRFADELLDGIDLAGFTIN